MSRDSVVSDKGISFLMEFSFILKHQAGEKSNVRGVVVVECICKLSACYGKLNIFGFWAVKTTILKVRK